MNRLRTGVCTILGCEVPIVSAGMGGPAHPELVAAITQAGAYGLLGIARESPDTIVRQIAEVREKTTRPFGVNLNATAPDPHLLNAQLQACLDANIAAVTLYWDAAPGLVRQLREAGITVVCQIVSAAEAQAAQSAGAAILVARGSAAGGPVRARQPLRSLLPEVLAVSTCPVLAAGGMTTGTDLAWALQSGAAGVMIGTIIARSAENGAGTKAHSVSAAELLQAAVTEASALLAQADGYTSVNTALASPVCYAGSANTAYSGMVDRDELVAALEALLQAARASAQVAGQTAQQWGQGDTGAWLTQVQHDAAKWCAMLSAALCRLDAAPSPTVGAFYGQAIAIQDVDARLDMLNREQNSAVYRLQNLIPRVSPLWLRDILVAMRKAHEDHIRRAQNLLAAHRKS